MKSIILPLAILAGGYFFPQVITNTSSPCQAVAEIMYQQGIAKREIDRDALTHGLSRMVLPMVLEHKAAERNPGIPPSLSCVASFYDGSFANR